MKARRPLLAWWLLVLACTASAAEPQGRFYGVVTHAAATSAGYQHPCALPAGGDLTCEGRNNSGPLGHLDAWSAASGAARANALPGFGPAH